MEVQLPTARAIFLEAIENHQPENWGRFLTSACADDLSLRNRVEKMLRIHDPHSTFMNTPAAELLTGILDTSPESGVASIVGTTIGRYRLLEKIGEGGMGTVYIASQLQPVKRNVALKITRAGMESPESVARFEAERQALALMNHPNIAKVLDGGVTESGRPYFVMELVIGQPITEFCDAQKLGTPERLQLFILICQAIQHAHQKGRIHRDLKPANVLVENDGAKSVPKVIDFGIAKAIGPQLNEHALLTGFHQVLGTPLYMSPEQADGCSQDLDTRSDVYSLGVILYQLLTGQTPFERETLRKKGYEEIRRMIREVDPPRPSVRVSSLNNAAISTISLQRGLDPGKLVHRLRGELDWITMKAMEKDRSRRYQSPSALAADLQRYLNDEPVLASPPSMTYRFRKTIRKHRGLLVFLLSIAASMILGTGISLWQASEAWHAQRQANGYLKQARTERLRFQNLAWNSGIREAYLAWEQRKFGETDELLERLKQSDPQAQLRPEWQMLRQELNQTFHRLLKISAPLHEVRLIPNSTHVAAVGGDGCINIVDLKSSSTLRTISTGISSLHALAISVDGRLLATGGAKNPVLDRVTPLIYDLQTGERICELPGQRATIESLEFSADGKWLACGARYEKVQLIEIETGRVVELPTTRRNLWLSRSSDGQRLAAQEGPKSVWVADFFPPFSGRSFPTLSHSIQSLWIPGTNRLVSLLRGATRLQLYDQEASTRVCDLAGVGNAVESFQVSGDSSLMVAGLVTGEIAVWPVGPVLQRAADHDEKNYISNDGFSKAGSQFIPRINTTERLQVSRLPITSVAIADDWLLATSFGGELLAVTRPSGKVIVPGEGAALVCPPESSAAFSPDGQFVVLGKRNGAVNRAELKLLTQTSRQLIESVVAQSAEEGASPAVEESNPWTTLSPLDIGHEVTAIAISADQQFVAWIRHGTGVVLYEKNQERILHRFGTPSAHWKPAIEFSPDSRRLAWTGESALCVVDFFGAEKQFQSFPLPGLGECMAWSPDGSTIAIGGDFMNVVEVNLKTGLMDKIGDSGIKTYAIRYSNGGTRIISGHEDGAIRFWTRLDGSMRSIHLHHSRVRSIALSADGRIGVSADNDGSFAVWLAETGERIGILSPQPARTDGNDFFFKSIPFFTSDNAEFRILFELPEHRLSLRTWDLKPIRPE